MVTNRVSIPSFARDDSEPNNLRRTIRGDQSGIQNATAITGCRSQRHGKFSKVVNPTSIASWGIACAAWTDERPSSRGRDREPSIENPHASPPPVQRMVLQSPRIGEPCRSRLCLRLPARFPGNGTAGILFCQVSMLQSARHSDNSIMLSFLIRVRRLFAGQARQVLQRGHGVPQPSSTARTFPVATRGSLPRGFRSLSSLMDLRHPREKPASHGFD